mmetsp:Transcript_31386/g.52973  ORF Transcript_31386/g.52973 Transcript_31386/m.52973 type:complete len:130 (-) Transcript_31386:1336-1725(-)
MCLSSLYVHSALQAFNVVLELDVMLSQKPAFVQVPSKAPIHYAVLIDATPTRAALGGAFRCSTTTDASVIMDMNSAKHWVYVSISTSAPGTEIFAKVVPVSTMLELSRVGVPKALFLIHLGPPVEFLLT